MKRLEGKVALVTGAGRGIGRSIAETFAREGAITYALSRAANETYPDGVNYRQMEVSEEAGWKKIVDEVIKAHGKINILVNNAGIIEYEGIEDMSLDSWNKIIGVNQTGVWLGMREVLPHMRKVRNGSIINVSSIWGNVAVIGAHAYHATKGAVRNMSKSAAISHAAENVRINSLHPGFIITPLTEAQDPNVNEWVVSRTPMGRAGTSQEVANCALFLASDESSFMTGSELVVDGGYLAQ